MKTHQSEFPVKILRTKLFALSLSLTLSHVHLHTCTHTYTHTPIHIYTHPCVPGGGGGRGRGRGGRGGKGKRGKWAHSLFVSLLSLSGALCLHSKISPLFCLARQLLTVRCLPHWRTNKIPANKTPNEFHICSFLVLIFSFSLFFLLFFVSLSLSPSKDTCVFFKVITIDTQKKNNKKQKQQKKERKKKKQKFWLDYAIVGVRANGMAMRERMKQRISRPQPHCASIDIASSR